MLCTIKHLMAGPEGNSELCFPRISMFPETKSRETLRFEGKKFNCFPRDQSSSDLFYSKTKQNKSKFWKNALRFLRQHHSSGHQATFNYMLWSRATAVNISRVTVHCFPFDVIVFAMLPAHGIWRKTVSLLDVLWPWTSQWMARCSGKNAGFITISNIFLKFQQEPMSRSMQLNYIPVPVFSLTDLFLDRIFFEWDSRGSAITNHKTLIDESLHHCITGPELPFFHNRKGVLKIDQSVRMPWHRLIMGIAGSRDVPVFEICKLAKWWRHNLISYDEKKYLSQFWPFLFRDTSEKKNYPGRLGIFVCLPWWSLYLQPVSGLS